MKIISTIQFAGGPIEIKLLSSDSIFEPIIPHINGLGFFEANLGMKNTVSSRVIGFEGRAVGRLQMTHFLESSADRDGILGVEEKGADFSFGDGGCNAAKRFAKDMNWTVGFGFGGLLVADARLVRKT